MNIPDYRYRFVKTAGALVFDRGVAEVGLDYRRRSRT